MGLEYKELLKKYEGQDDSEVYEELQERYLNDRNQDAFRDMYLLVYRLEKRYIRQYCRKNGLFKSTEEVNELAEDMTVWLMSMYGYRQGWKVDHLSAYAHFAFTKIMKNPNRIAEDKLKKELAEREPTEDDQICLYTFETEEEKRNRAHQERVAPGVSQGCLDFGEQL